MTLRALRRLLPAKEQAEHQDCEDLGAAPADAAAGPAALTPQGCAECLRDGTPWVHLRMCLTCGHVGCCDTGPYRHARRHAEHAAHPVGRSFEATGLAQCRT